MYHSDDAYEQILEDIGNMRMLSDDQFNFLYSQDKMHILAALYAMNKSQELLLGTLTPPNLSSKHMHKNNDDLIAFTNSITLLMKSHKVTSIKHNNSNSSTDSKNFGDTKTDSYDSSNMTHNTFDSLGRRVNAFTPLKNSIRPADDSSPVLPVTDLNSAHSKGSVSNLNRSGSILNRYNKCIQS
jgi:hypothetical protein